MNCEQWTGKTSPELDMLGAILVQAVADAGSPATFNGKLFQHTLDAHAFLTSPNGAWARSRRDIAEAVGVNPDRLREDTLRVIPEPGKRVVPRYAARIVGKTLRFRILDAIADGASDHAGIARLAIADPRDVHVALRNLRIDGLVTRRDNAWRLA